MTAVAIRINGETMVVEAGTTIAQVVARLTDRRDGIAVALNDELVTRSRWASTEVRPSDRVELLEAAQGG